MRELKATGSHCTGKCVKPPGPCSMTAIITNPYFLSELCFLAVAPAWFQGALTQIRADIQRVRDDLVPIRVDQKRVCVLSM